MKVIIEKSDSTELKVYTIKNVYTQLAIERMLELAAMANEAIHETYKSVILAFGNTVDSTRYRYFGERSVISKMICEICSDSEEKK